MSAGTPESADIYLNNNGLETLMTNTEHQTLPAKLAITLIALLVAFAALAAATPAPASANSESLSLIVRAAEGESLDELVTDLGGTIVANLDIINGASVEMPADRVAALAANPAVASVTENAGIQMAAVGWEADPVKVNLNTYDGSVHRIASGILQARDFWSQGYTGEGVDVALIDSGVVPVNGLSYPGKIVHGPDLSFESQAADLRHLDTSGHGTHLAGIIAGRDDGASITAPNSSDFLGVAPGSRIVSVKVADASGASDVSQVIAAIDWVVQHRSDNGLNIRVLNLAFGTNSVQDYVLDPLAFAVEQAWASGIVVVVSAGNDGNDHALRNPAMDPFVIAVGATNKAKTRPGIKDIMDFSNCGTTERSVDIVAPGESIASLRNPGSQADADYPNATVGSRYFLGSGTSQAAAFVSGAAALIIDRDPTLTPDAVKALLSQEATNSGFRKDDPMCVGAGFPNLEHVRHAIDFGDVPTAAQAFTSSTGLGSLEASRGSDHLEHDGVVLEGEQDIFGQTWDGVTWSTASASGLSWSGGDWNGVTWSGLSWSGLSWSGVSWSGLSWSGLSWSGLSWSDNTWNGLSWSGLSWSGLSWSGLSWSGLSWSGVSWD